MPWKKLGLLYKPSGKHHSMLTHASLPVAHQLKDTLYRVYFASRDSLNRSHVGFFDIDLRNPLEILGECELPVLSPGPLGYFDDFGVYPASIVHTNNDLYLYYIGWSPGSVSPLFYANVGLAVSTDGGFSFSKIRKAPILGRDEIDPWMVTSPCVLKESLWRMWYVGGLRWDDTVTPWQSYYHIKYAESFDGITWEKKDRVCIELNPGEHNIARTRVVRSDGFYEAWYSMNSGTGYRIGYAESNDGLLWNRRDEASGIDLSKDGWDSEAQAYPYVVDTPIGRYMLYNGNGFGRTGVGIAVWE